MGVSVDAGENGANDCRCSAKSSVTGKAAEDWKAYMMTIQSNRYEAIMRLETCLMAVPMMETILAILSQAQQSGIN